jgi:hypothetical protein
MTQLPPRVRDRLALSIADDDDEALFVELSDLLLCRVRLSEEIAQIRRLLKRRRRSQPVSTKQSRRGPYKRGFSTGYKESQDRPQDAAPGGSGRRSKMRRRWKRPKRSELERACRIALMEVAERPATIEIIYDRIENRGPVTMAGYRRPFRAITLVLNELARRGEALSSGKAGSRCWQWNPERVSSAKFA